MTAQHKATLRGRSRLPLVGVVVSGSFVVLIPPILLLQFHEDRAAVVTSLKVEIETHECRHHYSKDDFCLNAPV
jgi:hypothetical protein